MLSLSSSRQLSATEGQCVHLRTLSASLSPAPSKQPVIRAAGGPAVFEASSSTTATRHSRGDSGIPQKITRQTHTTWTRRICSVFSSPVPAFVDCAIISFSHLPFIICLFIPPVFYSTAENKALPFRITYFQLIRLTKLLDTHNLQFKGTVRLKIKLLSSFTVNSTSCCFKPV